MELDQSCELVGGIFKNLSRPERDDVGCFLVIALPLCLQVVNGAYLQVNINNLFLCFLRNSD